LAGWFAARGRKTLARTSSAAPVFEKKSSDSRFCLLKKCAISLALQKFGKFSFK